ncbi:MAG: hypothetical protein OXT09_01350 [Myxococcales bacterium]|nr:hypothetical protein [Myxococcales bacterium]
MNTERTWTLAVLLVATMVACSSDESGSDGMVDLGGGNDPGLDTGAGDDDGVTGDGDPGDGAAGASADPGATADDPTIAIDDMMDADGVGEGDDADAVDGVVDGTDCDADPHHPACLETHVLGRCDIDSGFPGDEACLLPPPPGQGIQVHIGPDDYNDPDQINKFLLAMEQEVTQCYSSTTTNEEDVYYQSYVLSGRAGTHHIINTGYLTPHAAGADESWGGCRFDSENVSPRIPGAAKAYHARLPVAPENAEIGTRVQAHTAITSDMHYFNFTDGPILREYWINLYTVPEDQVKQTSNRIRGYGGLGFNITPGTDNVYSYSCPIDADGRILALLGHTHAHAVRFTAWLNRAAMGDRLKVFETFDYLEPQVYAYNSVETNPEFSDTAPGAYTGMLEISAGDTLDWECHIINDSDATLRFTNEVHTGEMCNIWGESIGARIDCNRI